MSEGKKGFFARLKEGLAKTRNHIVRGIDAVFSGFSAIDDDFYEELVWALGNSLSTMRFIFRSSSMRFLLL